MKPTGATKDDDSWIDKLLDTVAHAQDLDRRVAARLQIKNAVNERESLRVVLQSIIDQIDEAVDQKIHKGRLPPIGALLSTIQDSARAVLSEENDATTSTSAGGG